MKYWNEKEKRLMTKEEMEKVAMEKAAMDEQKQEAQSDASGDADDENAMMGEEEKADKPKRARK